MISIAIHDKGSPVISRVVGIPSIENHRSEESRLALGLPKNYADDQCGDNEEWIEVSVDIDGSTHYVDVESNTVVERGNLEPKYSVSGLSVIFDGLPVGTDIWTMGNHVISDGDDELEFDVPGTYRITLYHPHYLYDSVEVSVG